MIQKANSRVHKDPEIHTELVGNMTVRKFLERVILMMLDEIRQVETLKACGKLSDALFLCHSHTLVSERHDVFFSFPTACILASDDMILVPSNGFLLSSDKSRCRRKIA